MTMSLVAGGGMCGPKVFLVSENASDQRRSPLHRLVMPSHRGAIHV